MVSDLNAVLVQKKRKLKQTNKQKKNPQGNQTVKSLRSKLNLNYQADKQHEHRDWQRLNKLGLIGDR